VFTSRSGRARTGPTGVVAKVPQVTVFFWVVKVLTTGMGEAASDSLVRTGGTVAVLVTAAVLVVAFVAQFRATRYVPAVYWSTVAMVSIVGTMAADIPRGLGIDLWVSTGAYLAAVVVIFVLWYRREGTLSFSAITAGRREWFYWAAVFATFALGTALGDLTADVWGLGNLASGLMFLVLIVLPVIATRWLGLDAVAGFWIAYVLTRPLGASFADWMGMPAAHGGLGMSTPVVALLWGLGVVCAVVYLAVTHETDHRTTTIGVTR
jgi:uncharacterized membrane-anchored protein